MITINPQLVLTPTSRVGVLVARIGMRGCVEFGPQRILETYPLDILRYHFTKAPPAP